MPQKFPQKFGLLFPSTFAPFYSPPTIQQGSLASSSLARAAVGMDEEIASLVADGILQVQTLQRGAVHVSSHSDCANGGETLLITSQALFSGLPPYELALLSRARGTGLRLRP